MSVSAPDFKTDITADPSKFEEGMRKAATSATQASSQIDAQFKKIGDTFTTVTKLLTGFTAVLAGGGALKKFISDANDWNGSAAKMAKAMGVSTEQASILNVALQHIGVESDTYITASQKLSKQIQGNAQAFDVLGVKTRDATGEYRPITEVMTDVNTKLSAIKTTIGQNIAGEQAYGKSWSEIKGIMKLTSQGLTEAEQRARDLGLIVGPEGAAMSRQYSMQMRDLNLVGKSLEVQFGNALLPMFTRLGSFMAKEGPQAGKAFALVLETIGFAAMSTWLALKDMGDSLGALAAQSVALLSGDFAAVKTIGAMRDAEAAKNEASYAKMKANFNKPFEVAAIPDAPDLTKGPHYKFKEKKEGGSDKADPSRVAEWEAELASRKATLERQGLIEGQYREMSKGDELKYWAELKSRRDLNDKEKTALSRKSADVEMAGIKQTFEQRVAILQTEAAKFKSNTEERLRIEIQIQAKYQEGTKEYEAAAKRIVEIHQESVQQQKQIATMRIQAERDARLQEITLEEETLKEATQLGNVTRAQVISFEQQFEERRNAIALEAIRERLQAAQLDPDRNPVEIERINLEIEAKEREHQVRVAQLRSAALIESQTRYAALFNGIQSGIDSVTQKLLNGTLTWRNLFTSTFGSLAQIGAKTISSIASTWIKGLFQMQGANKSMSLANIHASAMEAGAGAYKATVGIPYVGPFLAPAAAAVAYAGTMAFASAEGGYDIPASVNPLVQTHAREMILPARLADVIRGVADGGGAASASSSHVTYNDHSGRLTPDDLRRNAKVIADALSDHARRQA